MERYNRDNYQAAQIILANPAGYAGGLLEWARLWLANHHIGNLAPKVVKAPKYGQPSLFSEQETTNEKETCSTP
jgi:hypothetical protein